MGRYVNTALGQRWTDDPYPDEPGHLQYPPRTYQALGRLEGKVDVLVEMGAAQAAPVPPTPPQDPLNSLKRRMASDEVHLPGVLRCAFDHEGEIIAEALDYDGFTFTVDELVRLDILTRDGRLFHHQRAGSIVHAIREARGHAHPSATPGRNSL